MSYLNIALARRRTIRAPQNSMDKSTVVSIYPKEINEVKHTIEPGRFHIDPGTFDKPALLVVGSSSWWREIDEEQPLLEIPNSSVQVAKAIVDDYCNGLLACNMADSKPGLFFLEGSISLRELTDKFRKNLERAKQQQDNWYRALVRLADGMWARTNGNPLSISDDMRTAAIEMGITGKDWMRDFSLIKNIPCSACGSPRNPEFPVCSVCHTIVDVAKYNDMKLQAAK